jgi:hypothetical protein
MAECPKASYNSVPGPAVTMLISEYTESCICACKGFINNKKKRRNR